MKNEPLGLPKGSVRAILVLSIVVFAGIVTLTNKTDVPNLWIDLVKMLIPLYIGVQLPSGRENKQ